MTLVPRAPVDVKICPVVRGNGQLPTSWYKPLQLQLHRDSWVSKVQKDQEQEQANKMA